MIVNSSPFATRPTPKTSPSFDVEDGIVPNQINTRDLNHTLSAMFNYLTGVTEWLANDIDTNSDA